MVYRQVQDYFEHGLTLREGDIVFDIGAHIGLFTLAAYERANRNLVVYAFEPIPALFEALKRNASSRDPQRLRVFPYGLSRECGTRTFAYYPNATVFSTAYAADLKEDLIGDTLERLRRVRWLRPLVSLRITSRILGRLWQGFFRMEPVACQMVTVSSVMREHNVQRIDLLKVDVEKSEVDVLSGIADEDWPKIRQAVVEVHDVDHRLEQVTALLRARGFTEISTHQSVPIFRVFNVYAGRPTPPPEPSPR